MSELLVGVRVIESATLFNGDTLGTILGDLGADVVKLESPFQGDYLRDFLGQISPHHSPAHEQVNKNKRSVGLDLRHERGRDAFWRLLATADVFVDGNAADAMSKLGIGYDHQRAHKPDIIYCQYSGFGSTGPYAPIPTHGMMMNTLVAGRPHQIGDDGFLHGVRRDDQMGSMESGGEGTAAGAVHAALHVAAALTYRYRTGEGVFIDVAGCDGVLAQAWIYATYQLNDHRITDRASMPAPQVNGELTGAKYQFYGSRDGLGMLFCCIEPKFWRNFCRAVGRDDLVGVRDGDAPVDWVTGEWGLQLRTELQALFSTRDMADWMALAVDHDFPLGPAYRTLTEAKDDPHLQSRELIHDLEHPEIGPFTYLGEAGKVAGQPWRLRYAAPTLGEHTRALLGEVGYGDDELDALAADGVITTT